MRFCVPGTSLAAQQPLSEIFFPPLYLFTGLTESTIWYLMAIGTCQLKIRKFWQTMINRRKAPNPTKATYNVSYSFTILLHSL